MAEVLGTRRAMVAYAETDAKPLSRESENRFCKLAAMLEIKKAALKRISTKRKRNSTKLRVNSNNRFAHSR